MADIIPGLNTSDIFQGVWASMPPQFSSGIGLMLTLAKAIGIIFIIYLVFLVIQSIVRIREALRMKSMANNIEEINQKLSILVGSKRLSKSKDSKASKD